MLKWAGVFIVTVIFAMTPAVLRMRQEFVKATKVRSVAEHYRVAQWMDFVPPLADTGAKWGLAFVTPYAMPTLVLMLIIFLYSIVAFLLSTSGIPGDAAPIFLTAGKRAADAAGAQDYVAGTLIALVSAFFGTFVWSAGYVYRRLASYDLAPITYYQISLRLLSGGMVAVVIRHVLGISGDVVTTPIIVAASFAAGYDPSVGINWLRAQANKHIFKEDRLVEEAESVVKKLPVNVVNGISPEKLTRLEEFEIDDVQSLATANPVILYARTPFGLAEVTDWVAQAQLFQLIDRDKIAALKAIGVRDVLHFYDQCLANTEFMRVKLSEGETVPLTKSYVVSCARHLEADPAFNFLRRLVNEMIKRREWRIP